MTTNIVDVSSDSERAEVEAFFRSQIDDPSRFPLLPSRVDPHPSVGSIILGVWEGGQVVAALHAAPPFYDVSEMLGRGVPAGSGDVAMKDFVMLYSVAVAEGMRRGGVGAQLLGKMEDMALKSGSKIVYGVTSADTVAFYKARGYKVQKPDEMFRTYWGETEVAFPISGDAQWFTKGLKPMSSSWLANLVNT